jgi:uridylate kinase
MSKITVISLGGSIIAPAGVDVELLSSYLSILKDFLNADEERRLILVCGGGAPAREYQRAYRQIIADPSDEDQDWIGITATRLNAELIKRLFQAECPVEVVTDPTAVAVFPGRVLVAAGWKPGFSTDYDAVILAEKFQADTLINLSNIARVYSDDPKENPDAEPYDSISWSAFRELVGSRWKPGSNLPFDPIAARYAAGIGLRVIFASGKDIENLRKILAGEDFLGTRIGPG